jgi:hypothetical protein
MTCSMRWIGSGFWRSPLSSILKACRSSVMSELDGKLSLGYPAELSRPAASHRCHEQKTRMMPPAKRMTSVLRLISARPLDGRLCGLID